MKGIEPMSGEPLSDPLRNVERFAALRDALREASSAQPSKPRERRRGWRRDAHGRRVKRPLA
jgi:hypothetical protein